MRVGSADQERQKDKATEGRNKEIREEEMNVRDEEKDKTIRKKGKKQG